MEKSEYEFTHHVKIGKEFGVTDADIENHDGGNRGQTLETRAAGRRAILKGAREMVQELAMSEATFAEIGKRELSNEHMTDLVLTIAFLLRCRARTRDHENRQRAVLQRGTAAVPDSGSELTCA